LNDMEHADHLLDLLITADPGPFTQRRREMAHPVPIKGFLQLSPEAAMIPGPRVETHPPPPVPPFLLAQNLSPKDIARSDITS